MVGWLCSARMVSIRTGEFTHDGYRLVYSDYGSGTRPFVLVPGLLLPRSMHDPLARALAERGNRVITLDPLGHGESDRPADMWRYTMALLSEQVVGLMDHLELDEAVIGGTSLGANVTLETCVLIPDRLRGAVIEMPVLDNALLGCALAFAPLLVYLTAGLPLARVVSSVMRRLPRTPSAPCSGRIERGPAATSRPQSWWPPRLPWWSGSWPRTVPDRRRDLSSISCAAPRPPRTATSRATRRRVGSTRPATCTTGPIRRPPGRKTPCPR